MTRVLMVSMGVPGYLPARRHAGPGLRAAHFAQALSRAGIQVLAVCVGTEADETMGGPAPAGGPAGVETVFVDERALLGPALRRRIDAFAPDAVVGVTVYAAALALRLGLDRPLWADVFGDLLAEAQAKAATNGSDWSLVHFWTLLRPVLDGADHFSAVSAAQSHALVGQLGVAGRLSAQTAGQELVSVLPCAAEVGPSLPSRHQARQRLGLPQQAFVLLWSGGFNTWCDVETTARGVAAALESDERIHLVVSGGAIPGHDEQSFAAFERCLREALPAASMEARVHLLGWVASEQLPALYVAADLGLHIERPLYERRLGGENRVAEWLAHAVPCVTTGLSEAGSALVEQGLAWSTPVADPAALAERIGRLAAAPAMVAEIGSKGAEWAARQLRFDATAAPLCRWCLAPTRAGDHGRERFVRVGLLSRPQASTEILEAYVKELPLSQLLRRGLRWTLRRAFGRLGAAALLLGAVTGCEPASREAVTSRPNVLLLTIDTLRADHLTTYGYPLATSPAIDGLAARGVVLEQAVASSADGAPALASLLTGLYQDRSGVAFDRTPLPGDAVVLAERLAAQGYATAAFVGGAEADASLGLGQGFERFDAMDAPGRPGVGGEDRTVTTALAWLRSAPADRPWFVWVHLVEPHGPYVSAPPSWSNDFVYDPAVLEAESELRPGNGNFGLGIIPKYQVLEGATRPSVYVRRYDGEIRFSDAQVGALLGGVQALGALDDTLLVFTSDHGESLTEHSELFQHGWFLYDTTTRVPLAFSWPRRLAGGRHLAGQVCSVDIVPTILDLLGLDAPAADFDGSSFAPALLGAAPPASATETSATGNRECYSVGSRANHPFAVRAGGYKLILTPAGSAAYPTAELAENKETALRSADDRWELYDIKADPAELRDLHAQRPDLVEDLQARLGSFRARFRTRGWRW